MFSRMYLQKRGCSHKKNLGEFSSFSSFPYCMFVKEHFSLSVLSVWSSEGSTWGGILWTLRPLSDADATSAGTIMLEVVQTNGISRPETEIDSCKIFHHGTSKRNCQSGDSESTLGQYLKMSLNNNF